MSALKKAQFVVAPTVSIFDGALTGVASSTVLEAQDIQVGSGVSNFSSGCMKAEKTDIILGDGVQMVSSTVLR